MKRLLACVTAVATVLAPSALAVANGPASGPVELSLAYQGVLLVKVLDMTVEQKVTDDQYQARATLKSSGVLSLFKKVDVEAAASGQVEGGRLKPASFEHVNRDGRHNRRVQVRWTGHDVTMAAFPVYPNLGEPPASRDQKLAAADPLTQLTRIAASPLQGGPCRDGSRFFDGRQLYALDFSPPAPRPLSPREAQLGLTSPVACALAFNEVAGFDGKPAEKKNQGLKRPLSAEFARVGAGGPWVISAIRGGTPLGEARIEVRSLKARDL